ncbi:MAG: hypothetical protein AB7O57_08955 [Hyphomicrobiaceae bacterium]
MRRKTRSDRSHSLAMVDSSPCNMRFAPCLPEPERLVGLGFRYWMTGRDSGEIQCWERAFNLYAGHFGIAGARLAVTGLSVWVSAVASAADRDIEVLPLACRSFCRDECLAVSMIAACQHQTCPARRACAYALAESMRLDEVVRTAQSFADTLLGLDQVLSRDMILPRVASLRPARVH